MTNGPEPFAKLPYPWFGGKSRVASPVWERFGDVPNYVEPFFGGGAVLLKRPADHHWPRIETVNDMDGHLANFWRSVKADPDAVAHYADWPVSELDIHARGDWLFCRDDRWEFIERMRSDADYAKSAGWWVWFLACWIGPVPQIAPEDGTLGAGLKWLDGDAGMGVARKRPHLGNAGMGVARQLPHLDDAGQGVARQLPHLGNAGRGVQRKSQDLTAYIRALSERMERVRVCCGDWSRVTGPTPTHKLGITGVFLDPPYSAAAMRDSNVYSVDDLEVAHDVRAWCLKNGDNPKLRIALCGYAGEGHDELEDAGWAVVPWKASGGYGVQSNGNGRDNAHRERMWFSPHCLQPEAVPSANGHGKAQPALL